MESTATGKHPAIQKLVEDVVGAVGDGVRAVVLYGSAARGDFEAATSDLNVILVLQDLTPTRLEALGPALHRWERRGQPPPRLFSPELIAESADVFPIEFLDLVQRRVVVHGQDPFAELVIHPDHLRLQCERELREKMMRLREGYVAARGRPKAVARLLTESYTTFLALFRGCLHLLGGSVPFHNRDTAAAFCERAGLDRTPFDEVGRLKHEENAVSDPRSLFARYYEELTKAVHRVDRFGSPDGGSSE